MKQFTALLAVLGVLVFSAFFQAWSESRVEAKKASIAPVYDSTGAMLEAQNRPVVAYGNALELQYARSWLEAQNKPVVAYGNALELQYAQPWLDKANLPIAVTGKAQEQIPFICSSSSHMFYVCKYGYGLP